MKNFRPLLLINIFVVVTMLWGCVSVGYQNEMLPDGNSWKISYGTTFGGFENCLNYPGDDASCIPDALPHIERRGAELCSAKPYRIYGCSRHLRYAIVECLVQCNANPRHEVVPATTEVKKGVTENIKKNAKKCQSKGGVWINDSCQIDLDD